MARAGGGGGLRSIRPPEPRVIVVLAVAVAASGTAVALPRRGGGWGSRDGVVAELDAFLAAVEAAGQRPAVVYLGDDFEDRYRVRAHLDRPRWVQRFPRRPTGAGVAIWQLHGYSRIASIKGRVTPT